MAKKKNYDNVDLRTLPKDKRPKPTTGQSASSVELSWDAMSEAEREVVKMLDGKGSGDRVVRTVEYLSDGFGGDNPKLQARNALRRLVAGDWVERVDRGQYKISKNGRAKHARA